jgi:hypothetical protein
LQQYAISAGQNGEHGWDVNHQERKSIVSIELEQHHVIKFLEIKGLRLDEIATELFNIYSWDV